MKNGNNTRNGSDTKNCTVWCNKDNNNRNSWRITTEFRYTFLHHHKTSPNLCEMLDWPDSATLVHKVSKCVQHVVPAILRCTRLRWNVTCVWQGLKKNKRKIVRTTEKTAAALKAWQISSLTRQPVLAYQMHHQRYPGGCCSSSLF